MLNKILNWIIKLYKDKIPVYFIFDFITFYAQFCVLFSQVWKAWLFLFKKFFCFVLTNLIEMDDDRGKSGRIFND